MEYTLDSKQCAEVALYMYEKWKESQQPPLYVSATFTEWLRQIMDKPIDTMKNEPTQPEE